MVGVPDGEKLSRGEVAEGLVGAGGVVGVFPATLDTLTNELVNQLFHAPSDRLKGDPALAEEVLRLFAD